MSGEFSPVGTADIDVAAEAVGDTRRSHAPRDDGVVRVRRILTVGICDTATEVDEAGMVD